MNKWFERAIFLNILLIILYVYVDYSGWTRISFDFKSVQYLQGKLDHLRVLTSYNILFHSIRLDSNYVTGSSFEGFQQQSYIFNYPFLIFVIAIIVNMLIVTRTSKDDLK